jgi:cytochrome o ubiquinol oxidase subunit IV
MSTATEHHHGHGGHDHEIDPRSVHGHHDDDGGIPHATLRGYLTGFVLSVILTAIPFWLVMDKVFSDNKTTLVIVLAFAAVQIVVHMIYFLHLNTSSEGGWNMLALIFTMVLVVIALSGSLWVMYHMGVNMMPANPADMRNMP